MNSPALQPQCGKTERENDKNTSLCFELFADWWIFVAVQIKTRPVLDKFKTLDLCHSRKKGENV